MNRAGGRRVSPVVLDADPLLARIESLSSLPIASRLNWIGAARLSLKRKKSDIEREAPPGDLYAATARQALSEMIDIKLKLLDELYSSVLRECAESIARAEAPSS